MKFFAFKRDSVPVVATSVALCLACARVCVADPACDDNNGSSPYICVDKDGGTPVHGVHFVRDFSDPDNPSITLWTGNENWRVWSQKSETDDDPDNIGEIKIDPTVSTDDFGVAIANDTDPGAVNMGSIVLDDDGWTGHSSIIGGKITGDLSGNLTVIEDEYGDGGEVTLEIEGGVGADSTITIEKVNSLKIATAVPVGENPAPAFEGTLDVTEIVAGGNLELGNTEVEGNVVSGDIEIDKISYGRASSTSIRASITGSLVVGEVGGNIVLGSSNNNQPLDPPDELAGSVDIGIVKTGANVVVNEKVLADALFRVRSSRNNFGQPLNMT